MRANKFIHVIYFLPVLWFYLIPKSISLIFFHIFIERDTMIFLEPFFFSIFKVLIKNFHKVMQKLENSSENEFLKICLSLIQISLPKT